VKRVPFNSSRVRLYIVVSALMVASFWAGDRFHGLVWNPLVPAHSKLDYSSLNDIYATLQDKFDGTITDQAALDGAKAGLVAAGGDPYTTYLTSTQAKALNDSLSGSLSGIGAEIGMKNGLLTVISPIKGSPAIAAGVQSGDVIISIDGTDTTGMTVDAAVAKIRGKAGTVIKLKLGRMGVDPLTVSITRADITVPSVTWSMKSGNVGLITLSRFGPDTAQLTAQAATELKNQGAAKIILDLRNNGGGYLSAGVSVASEFLPVGKTVVSERTHGKTVDTMNVTNSGVLVGLPTVVLINGGSASASEIVAGALHDNGAATLLGEQSFGKGSVQEIQNLSGGAELKVTVAHWYTPKGVNINKSGLTPDIKVGLTTADFNNSSDPQLDAALAQLTK
jgi:carboxyl-terminal processing protease